ncbi:MAG TPA: glycine--tRNA ligase subunit beta, partial [Oligella sp.]|nr:glycine--tRNA ligase subunit beta [Oligella sp.]
AESLNTTIGDDPEVAALLDEVTALVEHPTVYVGQFDKEFLAVPQECLILTMRLNQKYFPLFDKVTGKLDHRFLIVSNMRPTDPSNIIEGNERVVRPRLADAQFFFDTDKKTSQNSRVEQLANVVYHNKLGSQLQRTERVQQLAALIASQLGTDITAAERAAYLAKADLTSLMVGEFPELQGVMAAYYAAHEQESNEVCQALSHQYDVRFNLEQNKEALTALILFIAERVETLVGIWGIGSIPTGERDPYGLRRAALGIISAYEWLKNANLDGFNGTQLDLPTILNKSITLFNAKSELNPNTAKEVYQFILERYRNQLQNTHSKAVIDAVLAVNPPLDQIPERVEAIEAFSALEEAESLAAANKRISNLLRKVEGELAELDESLLQETAEKELFAALQAVEPKARTLFADKDFAGSMSLMATVRPAVDNFFNEVMVMADDPAIRANRLALLNRLHRTMNLIADISCLA